jgi:hypothetical protein
MHRLLQKGENYQTVCSKIKLKLEDNDMWLILKRWLSQYAIL